MLHVSVDAQAPTDQKALSRRSWAAHNKSSIENCQSSSVTETADVTTLAQRVSVDGITSGPPDADLHRPSMRLLSVASLLDQRSESISVALALTNPVDDPPQLTGEPRRPAQLI